jgi:hypothetical protein
LNHVPGGIINQPRSVMADDNTLFYSAFGGIADIGVLGPKWVDSE